MYRRILRKPFRIWMIEKMTRLAKWLACPTLFGMKIMEHYSIELDVVTLEGGVTASRTITSANLLVQHYEVCRYRDEATAETEELLKNAEAIFYGANDQGEFK